VNPSVAIRITLLALGTLLAVAHWFIPRLTRPDLYFAVTVAPGFRDSTEGRFILRRYRRGLIGVSAVALALLASLALTPAVAAGTFGPSVTARRILRGLLSGKTAGTASHGRTDDGPRGSSWEACSKNPR